MLKYGYEENISKHSITALPVRRYMAKPDYHLFMFRSEKICSFLKFRSLDLDV